MITAIRKAHADKGPWVTNGGWEYNATLIAGMLALAESGPGRPSVDDAALPWLRGKGVALAQFAAAATVSTLLTSERFTQAEHTPAEGEAEIGGDPAAPRRHRFTREESEVPTTS